MNNLSTTAKKLDKVFEIAGIVLFAVSIACIVLFALICLAYVMKWDPEMIGTHYENFDIGFLELTIAEQYAPNKWLVLLQAAITLAASFHLIALVLFLFLVGILLLKVLLPIPLHLIISNLIF